MISRRDLFRGLAATAALGSLGSLDAALRHQQAHAASGVAERKFLFFFASGGWDATPLDPKFGPDGVSGVEGTDMDPGTWLGQAGELTYTVGDDRPMMDAFFRRWGARTTLVRGVDVHSAGHESGRKWMMTGTTASSVPDWPTALASRSRLDYPMPHVVFSGPSYPGTLGAAVVRGGGGTLLELIDGSILGRADRRAPVPSQPADSLMDAAVHRRGARLLRAAEQRSAADLGTSLRRVEAWMGNLERGMELEGRRFEAGLDDPGRTMLDQALMAVELMRLGLTRCAMIHIPGGWDTHGGNGAVGGQLDRFFDALDQLTEHLDRTPGTATRWLSGEVTLVAMSELGRTPRFNGSMGRDHWPYTSMMLSGSGVAGNRVVGQTNDAFIAEDIDLSTGRPAANGVRMGTEHVGATLLQLGGLDPDSILQGVPTVPALLRSGA